MEMASTSSNAVKTTNVGPPKDGADLASIVIQIPLRKDFRGDEQAMEFQVTIVEPLIRAGLSVRAFHSIVDMDGTRSIFLEVFASNSRLLLEAERIKLRLRLAAHELAEADTRENQRLVDEEGMSFDASGGDSEHLDLHIPRIPPTVFGLGRGRDPYDEIWAPFVPDPSVRHLYKVYHSSGFILSEMQALKLLISIIGARFETESGAGLNLEEMRVKRKIKRWFPAHNTSGIQRIYERWGSGRLPWRIPVESIKEYFSERTAFYFAFLEHFTFWLLLPALVGIGVFAHQASVDTPGVDYLPVYGILVAVWSTFFMESWKRQQNKRAQGWGMIGYAKDAPLRPEFTRRAQRVRSYVDGKPSYFSNPSVYRFKQTVTTTITLTALGAVIVVVGSIFWLRVVLKRQSKENGGTLPDGWPDYITSIINAVQIQIMNLIYNVMARKLTDFENHATVSAYDNSLTLKLAVFQSINSYFGLIYIAAIKNNIKLGGVQQQCAKRHPTDEEGDCMAELQSQLAILMLTRLVMGTINQFVLPLLLRAIGRLVRRCKYRRTPEMVEKFEEVEAARIQSHLEKEAQYPVFSSFDDYLEIMLQFGYVTLFVVAFPLAPLIALVSSMLNIYMDSDRMLRLTTRPIPEGAQDIGAWRYVFEAMSYASAITNLTIVVFTNNSDILGYNLSDNGRLIFFIVSEHIVLLIKYSISTYIPDETFNTSLQLARQNYLVAKHVHHVKDLVISKEETAAALASAKEIDEDANRVDPASVSPPPTQATKVMTNPIRTAVFSSQHAIRVAPSYFHMMGKPDPRKLTVSGEQATAAAATQVQPVVIGDAHGESGGFGYVVAPPPPEHGTRSGDASPSQYGSAV